MVVHSTVDFSMHVPANMALLSVLGGLLARFSCDEASTILAASSIELHGFKKVGRLILGIGLSASLAAAILPLLWRQWVSESNFVRSEKELYQIVQDRRIDRASVLRGYRNLLNARRFEWASARIQHGFGKVYQYFGLMDQNRKIQQNAWFEKAERAYQDAIRQAPWKARYQFALGQLYHDWNRYGDAPVYLKHAARLEPQNPLYRFKFGENEIRLGNPKSAGEAFKETLGINMNYLESILTLLSGVPSELNPSNLIRLLPEGDEFAAARQQMATFFALKKQDRLADAIRNFSPLEKMGYGDTTV
jgi:tetratricopeptide (TPR) repeat protein